MLLLLLLLLLLDHSQHLKLLLVLPLLLDLLLRQHSQPFVTDGRRTAARKSHMLARSSRLNQAVDSRAGLASRIHLDI